MRRIRIIWMIYPAFLGLVLVCLVGVAWYSAGALSSFYENHIRQSLEARARLVTAQVEERLQAEPNRELQHLFQRLGDATATRYTAIKLSGRVLADSQEAPELMEPHNDRPEFLDALQHGLGAATRYSRTIRRRMMYVGVPYEIDGAVQGVVRASIPLTEVEARVAAMHARIALAGAVASAAAGLIGLIVSRRISRPIRQMRDAADRFAKGDLAHKLAVPTAEELGVLAESMNKMAGQLDDRIRALVRQQAEIRAILSSMVEGVIAVDSSDRVITLNHAAADLVGVELANASGRDLGEVVRNPELQAFVAKAQAASEPVKAEIAFHGNSELMIEAHGAVLRDASGKAQGAVVVLHDVTHLRRLESVRRDFVANVSHELRTPVTSIRGFVETLLSGAMRDPEDAERFLTIIARQTERLTAIIEDLLALSTIEQQGERAQVQPRPGKVRPALVNALELCDQKAGEKGVELQLRCDADLSARMIPELIEQAVVNLLDNAIKYSPPGSEIGIEAGSENGEVAIRVRDQGCGVPPEDRDRIFERFFRVDKARSRSLGGTGLGLSIVKHIMQAHGGTVTVDSRLGEGSVFTLRLPAC